MTAPTDFEAFRAAALAEGYTEVLPRSWAPDTVVPEHTHPFAVKAVVVDGELWLGCADGMRHLRAGDHFELAADAPHTERYGPAGATYWVARR